MPPLSTLTCRHVLGGPLCNKYPLHLLRSSTRPTTGWSWPHRHPRPHSAGCLQVLRPTAEKQFHHASLLTLGLGHKASPQVSSHGDPPMKHWPALCFETVVSSALTFHTLPLPIKPTQFKTVHWWPQSSILAPV